MTTASLPRGGIRLRDGWALAFDDRGALRLRHPGGKLLLGELSNEEGGELARLIGVAGSEPQPEILEAA